MAKSEVVPSRVSSTTTLVCTFILMSSTAWCSASKVYTVGDSAGWGLAIDYNAWTQDKIFKVGDALVFNYPIGHTVDTVSKTDYDSCADGNAVSTYSTGSTTIVLRSPGTHYFICGGTGHCVSGMKLAVKVAAIPGSSSSSTPGSGGSSSSSGGGGTRTPSGGRTRAIYAPPPPDFATTTPTTHCPPAIPTINPTPPAAGQAGYGYGSYGQPPTSLSYEGYSNSPPNYPYSPTTPFPYFNAPTYDDGYGNKFSTSSSDGSLPPHPLLAIFVTVANLAFLTKLITMF